MANTQNSKNDNGTSKRRRGRGEGTIFEERGKYRAQVSVGGRRLSKTFSTKTEALEWKRKTTNDIIDKGLDFNSSQKTLGEYLAYWLELKQRTLKPTVFPSYQLYVERDLIPHLGKLKLRELRAPKINQFYGELADSGYGPRSVYYVHQVLSGAINHGIEEGVITINPMKGVIVPQYEAGEMCFLEEDQVHQLLIAARNHLKYEALYDLAVKYGIRQAELMGLRWSDLDWERRTLTIQRQMQKVKGQGNIFTSPKTKASRRTIPLGANTIALLRKHQERQNRRNDELRQAEEAAKAKGKERQKVWQDNGLIFASSIGSPLDKWNLKNDFFALLEEAGIDRIRVDPETGKKVYFRFHDLRHTAASIMIQRNQAPIIVVSRLLGHSKVSITLDVYGHLMTEAQHQVVDDIDDLLTPIEVDPTVLTRIDKQ